MNCKPGDLAVIVRGRPNSPNIGKLVLVVELWAGQKVDGFRYSDVGEQAWVVESIGGNLVTFATADDMGALVKRRVVTDSCLRPIRGDEEPESIETTKEKENVA